LRVAVVSGSLAGRMRTPHGKADRIDDSSTTVVARRGFRNAQNYARHPGGAS